MSERIKEATSPRESIRIELETAKAKYHALLDSLTDEDWHRASGNPAWTIGELLWHIAAGVDFVLRNVERVRQGKGMSMPSFLVPLARSANVIVVRRGARKNTLQSVRLRYDAAHQKVLALLDRIKDDEWQKEALLFGRERTVVDEFHYITAHFEEHAADINKALGRD